MSKFQNIPIDLNIEEEMNISDGVYNDIKQVILIFGIPNQVTKHTNKS